jgi:hypothetical protein
MRLAIDYHRTGTANAFPAIVLKGNGLFLLTDEILIEYIEHLKERHVFVGVNTVGFKTTFGFIVFLSPDFYIQFHYLLI